MRRSKSQSSLLVLTLLWFQVAGAVLVSAKQTAPGAQAAPASSPAAPQPNPAATQPNAGAPPANPAPPPSTAAPRSADDLDKLVAPIALYPDPLIATVLPAAAYPLEIVQAARFVSDTNNIAKLDSQQWDSNVKAVARFPDVIAQMDKNISWTSDLGDAFINQPKELMDAIQRMRTKAEDKGALKTTEQQVVTVTNEVVSNVVNNETVYVTNQVTQIQPAQPDVVYVPQYNPTVVYGAPVAYPSYAYPAYYPGATLAASALSFGAGMAVGAWLGNDCDWGHGGCFHSDVNVNRDVNRNVNRNVNANRTKWQPNQNRLKNSGSSLSSAQNRQARGYGSAGGQAGTRAGAGTAGTRASGANAGTRAAGAGAGGARASTANAGTRAGAGGGARASTANAGTRAAGAGTGGARASTANAGAGARSSSANAGTRPSATGRTGGTSAGSRAASSPGARSSGASATGRASSAGRSSGAFSGASSSGAAARSSSARGAASRGGGARGGGGRGGGGRR